MNVEMTSGATRTECAEVLSSFLSDCLPNAVTRYR